MYFIIVLIVGLWLGYKLKTLVEFLRLLKMKNYIQYYMKQFEEHEYKVIRLKDDVKEGVQ